MKYSENNHTFVVCAYKESPYLGECIESLLQQTKKSRILISTSTPNASIQEIAKRYELPVVVNTGKASIADDWNYGCSKVETELFTIAHQDDIYEKNYLEEILKHLNRAENPLIAFTDYGELRNGKICLGNTILKIKRLMLKPLTIERFWKSKWVRRRVLSFGDPICCPSVTYIKENVGDSPFDTKYINSCDYKTYVELAQKDGAYIYIPEKLLSHRIYPDSATSKNLGENIRKGEDLEILSEFWPKWIARFINYIYAFSEKSNNL